MAKLLWVCGLALLVLLAAGALPATHASDVDDTDIDDVAPAAARAGAGHGTDANTVAKEAAAIKVDGLSAADYANLKASAEKQTFQAEVSRMMKLIINSLYTNKEIFLRELISNASDALDKIRFLSLTDPSVLGSTPDLQIKIHVDKENKVLHITDTGVGMTRDELVRNLGTIAKSGTGEFLAKAAEGVDTSNLIGQFGVGFYSAFLVADTVVVTSKHNDDKQYIWESDSTSFTVVEDTRVDEQLGRGTRVSLYLKEEAADFLETKTLRDLIVKYSEFIAFDIFLYTSKTIQVEEEEADETEAAETAEAIEAAEAAEDSEATTEEGEGEGEGEEEEAPAKKMVDKTVWEWEVINANKPIWTRAEKDVAEADYTKFYQAFSKASDEPIGHIHFTAEGEVTFRSILYIPGAAPANFFTEYGKGASSIKMYVRRVFITDTIDDLLPKYLSFITGVVDSDDLPLNVSRESLQQHKLLKVIKKKLVRKALELLKKLDDAQYKKFWKEFGTSIKLGVIEDYANRTRLAKLLRFHSSHSTSEHTSLEAYVSRMKKDQDVIYFVAGASLDEVRQSPFTERLLRKGYEVLYLTEPVDEYTLQNLPEFDNKKFQNAAKEGLKLAGDDEAAQAAQAKTFAPLTAWLGDKFSGEIEKAVVSQRLSATPCALVASQYGWSGNMERIMKAQAYAKQDDSAASYYGSQKKVLEINPRHPLIKKLLQLVTEEAASGDAEAEQQRVELAHVMLDAARIRSGFSLGDTAAFAARIERVLRLGLGVDPSEAVEVEPEVEAEAAADDDAAADADADEEVAEAADDEF